MMALLVYSVGDWRQLDDSLFCLCSKQILYEYVMVQHFLFFGVENGCPVCCNNCW